MDLVDRLPQLDQPGFEQFLHTLLGVEHHRIAQDDQGSAMQHLAMVKRLAHDRIPAL